MGKTLNPTQQDLDSFLRHYDRRTLANYKRQAKNTLLSYIATYTDVKVKEEREKLKEEAILKEVRGFWKPVFQGIAASAIFTFGLFLIAFVIAAVNPKSSFGQLMQFLSATDKYDFQIIEKKFPKSP